MHTLYVKLPSEYPPNNWLRRNAKLGALVSGTLHLHWRGDDMEKYYIL